jgi:hypothetical protein
MRLRGRWGNLRAHSGHSRSFDPSNWADSHEEVSDDNKLWRQYMVMVDLHRYYMDLTWKVTIWYYTAVGAALIYFFDHLNETSPGYLEAFQ